MPWALNKGALNKGAIVKIKLLLAVFSLTFSDQAFAWGRLRRGACIGGFSTTQATRTVVPICPGPSGAGGMYLDSRTGAFSEALSATARYFARTGVGPDIQTGPGTPCVLAEESGAFPGGITYPFYQAGSPVRTFGIPPFIGSGRGGSPAIGRLVDSMSTMSGPGDFTSWDCVFLRGADLARYDVFVTNQSKILPLTTYDDDGTWGTTVMHEFGHVMGLGGIDPGTGASGPGGGTHDDRWPAVMNTTASPVGGEVLAGITLDYSGSPPRPKAVYKGDGDMTQGMSFIHGWNSRTDYGISAQRPSIDPSFGLVTSTESKDITVDGSDFQFTLGFVAFNHGRWSGGDVFIMLFEDDARQDPVLNDFQTPSIFLNRAPLPRTADLFPFQILSQGATPGNIFFNFSVPVVGSSTFAFMTPGKDYRVVLYIAPPVGFVDSDPLDNWISTDITFKRN